MSRKKVLASGLDRVVHPINEQRETKLNTPSQAQLALPYFGLLPTDPVELLKWKLYVRTRCLHDDEFREAIIEACREDVLFFAATFVWIFEPRPPRAIPFTPWCDQADVIAWIEECVRTHRDMGVEKSRGIGLSWDIIIVFYWLWLFTPDVKLGCMSKDEDVLDGDDANYLLGKFVFIHDHMPAWLKCDGNGRNIMLRNKTRHTLINALTGAAIQGFPSTDSKVRSLRFTAFFYDEFAFFTGNVQEQLNSSVHTAPCRIFISTWNGVGNMFHTIMRRSRSTMLRVLSYWWANPERFKGAYRYERGMVSYLDKEYPHVPDYPFIEDGLLRSPWVDYELSRAGSDLQTALEELYGLRAESGRKFFRGTTVEIMESSVEPPTTEGRLEKIMGVWKFVPSVRGSFGDEHGGIRVWGNHGNGLSGPYVAGCDIAFGQGASYSTLQVIDLSSGKQILEYGTNGLNVDEFAEYVCHILDWLNGPLGNGHTTLIFENNGTQGNGFGRTVQRVGYGNVVKNSYSKLLQRRKEQEYLGMKNKDGGLMIFTELERAVRQGECLISSDRIPIEASNYDKDDKGKPTYPMTLETHGDFIMGLALAWEVARERVDNATKLDEDVNPYSEIMTTQVEMTKPFSSRWRSTRKRF